MATKRPFGTVDHCIVCGAEFVVRSSTQKYCDVCGHKAANARNTAQTRKAYDRMEVRFHKGERQKYMDHAEKMGESVNQFFVRAITNQLKIDNENCDKGDGNE